jgi:hypothetical protein
MRGQILQARHRGVIAAPGPGGAKAEGMRLVAARMRAS